MQNSENLCKPNIVCARAVSPKITLFYLLYLLLVHSRDILAHATVGSMGETRLKRG